MRYEKVEILVRKLSFGRGQAPTSELRVIHSRLGYPKRLVSASFPVVNIGKLYTSYSQVVDKLCIT